MELEEVVSNLTDRTMDFASDAMENGAERKPWVRWVNVAGASFLVLFFGPIGGLWVFAAIGESTGAMARVDDNLWFMGFLGSLMLSLALWAASIILVRVGEKYWSELRRNRIVFCCSIPMVCLMNALLVGGFISEVIDVARSSLSGAIGMAVVGGLLLAYVLRLFNLEYWKAFRNRKKADLEHAEGSGNAEQTVSPSVRKRDSGTALTKIWERHWSESRRKRLVRYRGALMVCLLTTLVITGFISSIVDYARSNLLKAIGMTVAGLVVAYLLLIWNLDYWETFRVRGKSEPDHAEFPGNMTQTAADSRDCQHEVPDEGTS